MLYTFGDSFTDRNCLRGDKQQLTRGFQDILSEKLNMELESCGLPGCSCYDVINMITSRFHLYQPGDTIIALLPTVDRRNHPVKNMNNAPVILGDLSIPYSERDRSTPTLSGLPLYANAVLYTMNQKSREEIVEKFNRIYYIKTKDGVEKQQAIDHLIHDSVNANWDQKEFYENYFFTWIKNLNLYFKKHDIRFKAYTSNWWKHIFALEQSHELVSNYVPCECGHWNELGHEIFAEQVLKDLDNNTDQVIHTCKQLL